MTNKDYYFLSKLAKAEKTIKQATVTTCTHKSLTPTEPVVPALGESDKIMYGQGSVAKTAGSGAVADLASAVGTNVLNQIPFVNLVTGPASTVGAITGLAYEPEKLSKEVSPVSFIPGAGHARVTMRRRQVDRERSKGKRDRSAYLHEMAGSITNALLLGLLGAGVGAGVSSITGGVSNKDILQGAGIGGLIGLGGSVAAGGVGSIAGLIAGNKKQREEYLQGKNNMLKNYLIPGYAGFQRGSGLKDWIANT